MSFYRALRLQAGPSSRWTEGRDGQEGQQVLEGAPRHVRMQFRASSSGREELRGRQPYLEIGVTSARMGTEWLGLAQEVGTCLGAVTGESTCGSSRGAWQG